MANKRFIVRHGLDNSGDNSVVNTIINVAEPVNNSDAATKYYVDTHTTGGTVTSVTATSPVESTGGTTPVISLGTGANGQLVIGTGTGFTKSTLTAGTGVSIANASGSITISATGSGGDVVGPASATDNAVTRFDSTTGKLIQNSTVTLDDNGNFGNVNSVVLDNTPATLPTGAGTMYWEDGEGTAEVILKGGNTTLKVGTQEYARVYNDSGSTITLGQVVYISGAQGNRIAVKLAQADVEANSFGTLGLVAETIANGAEGWVIVSGALYKLNTNGLTAGAVVYLSPTTAGAYTTTKPQAPDQLVVLGFVERVSSTVGSIYVKVDNGYELDELHDVRITSPVSGNTLIYDATTSPTGVWKNASLTAGTGISVTNGAGSITIGNTGVTSVSGTSPVVSSGGATPAISLASGYGDTQNPYGSKTANYFLASPNGSAGVPTWRSIVAADIPTLNQNTTGTAANVTGTVAVANGGTGLTSLTAGYIPYGNGTSAFGSSANLFWDSANSRLGVGTASPSQKLDVNGGIKISGSASLGASVGTGGAVLDYQYPTTRLFIGDGSGWDFRISSRASSTTTDRVTFLDNGSVGIGTATPAYKLDVNGTINGSTYYSNTVALAVTSGSYNLFYRQDGGVGIYLGGADPANYYDNTAHIWRDRAGSEGMRLNSTGLGIGTASPYNKVEIEGASARLGLNNGGGASRKALLIEPLGYGGNTYARLESYDYGTSTGGILALNVTGGNVGIGTSSPRAKLDVSGNIYTAWSDPATTFIGMVYVDGADYRNGLLLTGNGRKTGIVSKSADSTGYIWFGTGSSETERMRIDSSGNVGIGVTPSAWGGSFATTQYKGGFIGSQASGYLYTGQNTYYNGTDWKYINTAAVTMMEQSFGAFVFLRAASGTAGNNVSFSESMRIDSSGNVGIGVASPSKKLQVNGGDIYLSTAGSSIWFAATSDSGDRLRLHQSGGNAYIDWGGGTIYFRSGASSSTARMDISGSGVVTAAGMFCGNSGAKGFGAITTTTTTSTPTGGQSGDFVFIYQ